MPEILKIAIFIVMGLVVVVLLTGVVAMFKGGRFNERYGNKLMRSRVALQALAIGLLALLFFVFQASD